MFRTWPVGSAEPTAWAYSGSDASVLGPGRVFLTHVRGSSNTGARAVLSDDLVPPLRPAERRPELHVVDHAQ